MKQFTRRTSQKAQLDVDKRSEECHNKAEGQPQSKCTKVLKGAVAADPYSFELEDDTAAQAKLAKVSKPNESQARQGVKQNAQASTSAAPQPASKPGAQPPAADPQPGPPKQPQPAGAQHVASCAAHKETLPNNRKVCTVRDTQTKPLPPSKAPAPAEPSARTAVSPPAPAVRTASAGSRRATALLAQRPAASGGRQNSGGVRNKAAPSSSNPTSSNPTSSKSASSGGARKLAAVGSKRGRGVTETAESQQQQQFSNSGPPGSVAGTFASPDPAASTSGAISLPTPHRRPRQISAGLLAAAAAAAGSAEARAAQTVMEAQERGELVQMQDEASYALGGMGQSCSIDTQRDSAVTITEMLSTRKGRTALRSDGLAQQFLTNLAKLKAAKDCVLGLAATSSLWYLTADDANPCFLASTAAAVLLDQLLQVDFTFEEVAAKGAAGSKLCRLVRVRPLATLLSSTGVTTSRGLLLVTLEQATSSQHASKAASVEKLKHNLRQFGALQRLAALVADTAAAPGGPVAASKQLHLLLLVLENATFTCPDNGTALSQLQICPGSKGSPCKPAKPQQQQQRNGAGDGAGQTGPGQEQQQAFPAVLVGVAQQLLQGVDSKQPRAALHALLSVMMNLIHDNKQGGALLCSQGGMAVAADTYSKLLQPSAGSQETLCAAVLQHLELVSASLGVLMNLVSNEPQHSRQLAAGGAGDAAAATGSSGSSGDVSSFVRLLCTVMTALGQLLKHHMDQDSADPAAGDPSPTPAAAAAGGGGGSSAGLPTGAKVVTSPSDAAEALGSNTASEASIVEVYSGILLGFLVRDGGPGLAAAVAGLLPGGSLDPLTSATGRCLDFYVRTGAITDHTKATLQALLQQLTELKAGLSRVCDGSGDGGGVGGEQGDQDSDVMLVE